MEIDNTFWVGCAIGAAVQLGSNSLRRIPHVRKPWPLLFWTLAGGVALQIIDRSNQNLKEKLRREKRYYMEQRRSKFLGAGNEHRVEPIINDIKADFGDIRTEGVLKYKWVEIQDEDKK
eukprot:GEZU01039338.1.p2 GENE.GEZU01039338.1~~GEZU01039338.1.p2  ORF type:complete len:130 (+),score=36.58 GEZU01039338.1:35-391(+)